MTIRVLICDDQEIVCEGLEKILNSDPDIEVVGIARDGAEVLKILPDARPDLVLMDLKMPVMNGVTASRKIHEKYPGIPVLVLTTYDDDEWVFDAIRSGASGYLLKDTPREGLIKAIKGTLSGESFVDPGITRKLLTRLARTGPEPERPSTLSFSDREMEILQLLARGLSNAEIAQQLYLSEGTVRNYTSAIFSTLSVSDRTQAAVAAIRYGFVNLNDL
ncbi:MAG: response regulator transcription factor [Anaerolineales bacterium]|nr:response regulator transcription factor [Anaerolineales bacterium]